MVVIDTHVLVWWASGDGSLSQSAAKSIEEALDDGGEVVVSCISAWEIAMLVEKGRLILSMDVTDWLDKVMQIEGISFVPIDSEIGVRSATLPGNFHKDPADRMIVATARKLAVPLVTADEKIRNYRYVETIW